jgi:malate synthase
LQAREAQKAVRAGFDEHTANQRRAEWHAAPIPDILQHRCIEITVLVDAKTVINALNSKTDEFIASFEDSTAMKGSIDEEQFTQAA